METEIARAIMFCLIPVCLVMVAAGISSLLKPIIPEGPIKRALYRR